jgi:hypothetical protein
MHRADADRPNPVAAPGEHAENPAASAVAKGERSPLSVHDRIAHDVHVALKQRFDLRQRNAMPEAFWQVAAIPVEAPELHEA